MEKRVAAGLVVVGLAVALLGGCGRTAVPDGCRPVTGFHFDRYLGTWNEVYRLDNSFERGLSRCNAEYRLRPDGRVDVINRGYRESTGRWEKAAGVAVFLGNPGVGSLKVSFFEPFWGGYHHLALDPDYRAALVAGSTCGYLWVLCRHRSIDPDTLYRFVAEARTLGFPTDRLVSVDQSEPHPRTGAAGGLSLGEGIRRDEWDTQGEGA